MLTITFTLKPEVMKRRPGWSVHVGGDVAFLAFATKRSAEEYLAESGRMATRWTREINAVYRDVMQIGQGWACSMSTYDLIRWARLKADFDTRLADLAMRSKSRTPGHALPKVRELAGAVIAAIAHINAMSKISYTGDQTALEMAQGRMLDLQASIDAWRRPGGQHGGSASERLRMTG